MDDVSPRDILTAPLRVPAKLKGHFEAIVALTDEFSAEHLNADYAALCRELTAALARKRPSPLLEGDPQAWACAVVYAIGRVNFLFDRTQSPHLTVRELCSLFDLKQSTVSAKGQKVMRIVGMYPYHPGWCLPALIADNPLVWLIEVDGLFVDVRMAPREIQEEAYRRGLIPYVPE